MTDDDVTSLLAEYLGCLREEVGEVTPGMVAAARKRAVEVRDQVNADVEWLTAMAASLEVEP
ncbi:MAG TPA: hypothetical protein VI011_17825 [Asanoa sp.]